MALSVECIMGAYLKEPWLRKIAVKNNTSLFKLHDIVQQIIEFDEEALFSFYTANTPKGNKIPIDDIKPYDYCSEKYHEVSLDEVFPLGRKKLYYKFDLADKWLFEIKQTRIININALSFESFYIVEKIGANPMQYSDHQNMY